MHRPSCLSRACAAFATALSATLAFTATPAASAAPREITWEPCPPHVTTAGATCGRVNVPMDYDNPDGEQISVGFVKVAARGAQPSKGTLFTNPGGPGGDAYGYVGTDGAYLWPQELRDEWDMVAVQPRGLRHSTVLECAEANPSPVELYTNRGAINRQLCDAPRPGYTRTLTTQTNAKDWESVRQALGTEQVSIMGLSYGTYLGSAYASAYPQHTDRVVLDSGMDPQTMWGGLLHEQIAGYEGALNDYFTFVAENNDTYQMGTTPLQAYNAWSAAVTAEAGTNPTVTPPAAQVADLPPELAFTGQAGADAMTATGKARVELDGIVSRLQNPGAKQTNSALYMSTHQFAPLPIMWDSLARTTNGSAQQAAEAQAAESEGAPQQPDPALVEEIQGQQVAQLQMLHIQACNENVVAPDYSLIPEALWAEHTGDVFVADRAAFASGLACAGAPPVVDVAPLDGSQLDTPPLQLNATGDPQTVYKDAAGLAEPMGAHLVTVHGPGHAQVATGNPVVDQHVVEYLRTGELGPAEQQGHAPQPLPLPETAEPTEDVTVQ